MHMLAFFKNITIWLRYKSADCRFTDDITMYITR